MRPLMATFLEVAEVRSRVGHYDELTGVTVGPDGRPLLFNGVGHETVTKVPDEPADDAWAWDLDTPKQVADGPNDHRIWAFETATRVADEPADDHTCIDASNPPALPPSDDLATGVVSF